jgi:23S rRNA (uracil1939-C5)-methyltransferase/tRNA (uracil-5-)-methyltransferase
VAPLHPLLCSSSILTERQLPLLVSLPKQGAAMKQESLARAIKMLLVVALPFRRPLARAWSSSHSTSNCGLGAAAFQREQQHNRRQIDWGRYRRLHHHHHSTQQRNLKLLSSLSSSNSNGTAAVRAGAVELPSFDGSAERDAPASETKAAVPPRRFVDFPFGYHQELILEVESLTNRGWGVGRVALPAVAAATAAAASRDENRGVDNSDNNDDDDSPHFRTASAGESDRRWVVLVAPGVIPGEVVKVRVFRNFNRYSEADLVEVVFFSSPEARRKDKEGDCDDQPATMPSSPGRVEPRCSVFAECGGCQYQHMDVELQRYWKTRHVQEAMEQYGIDARVSPCLGTPHTYGYRSKLTPHYHAPSSKRDGSGSGGGAQELAIRQIGFQRQTSRQIVDVERCAIATDPINDAYRQIREELLSPDFIASTKKKKKNKGATLLLRQGNSFDAQVVTEHQRTLTTSVLGMNFTYLAGNFFQNNYYVLPLMVQTVVDAAAAPLPPNDARPAHLIDCYCGSGLFAVSAAARFESVIGIEINERAVQEATANAEQNGLSNCRFVSATAEHIFRNLEDPEGAEMKVSCDRTVVVLDPPRNGCSESFLQQLLTFAPARIVYLSCDPVTQARDVANVLQHENVRYEIESVQPFDLFPQTRHIECLVVLNRR